MAQDNFESILKRKLEERRLQPSDNAWERIRARKRPERKVRPLIYWIAAACVTLLAGWFWTQPEAGQPKAPASEVVVETPMEHVAIPAEEPMETKKAVPVMGKAPTGIADVTPRPTEEKTMTEVAIVREETIAVGEKQLEDHKINTILDQLDQLQQSGQSITEATVDSLLARAQRELALEKQQAGGTDALRLLAETEKERDRSFKERVFAAISKFRKVRIATGN